MAVTINKGNPRVTAPTAKTLTYTGSAQALVNAGSTSGGTLYYAVTTENKAPTEESLYTTAIPTGTDTGTYFVWYKVVGDDNYNDSGAASVTVTIKEAASPAADPASPVHKTDGSNIEKVEKDSAKYSFNVNVNTAAISFTKENIRLGFSEIRDIPEYSLVAEHRYRTSNKRITVMLQ